MIADAEALLKATANSSGEAVANLRDKTARSLSAAKNKIVDANDAVVAKGKAAARATDDYVQDNPWKTAGISAGIGLLIGLLISNKK